MRRKLRVTQVVHDFYPVVGGIETYAYNIAKGLVDAGHLVKVYTARMPGLPAREIWQGIHVHRFHSIARPFSYPFMPGLTHALTQDSCDILHAHINSPMTVDFTAFAARLMGVPLVITYHADALIHDIAARAKKFRRWLSQVYWLSRHIAASIAARLIVTSPIYLESSKFLQRYRYKTSIVPAVVDPFFLTPLDDKTAAKESLGYAEDDLLVLFVGRLVPYKGLRVLFRAFRYVKKRIPKVRLSIVGSGPEYANLTQLSHELGLTDIIRFHSVLSQEELRDAYSACDLFVLPSRSRSEAFGIVLLEAMARGKPVVATHVGGIPYVVNDKETGILVPPYDPKPLADAICLLLKNPELREKMGQAAREHVLQKFTRKPTTKQLEKVYFELLS
jgi:glycosyltransferase involved in cell wall biosynthesis